MAAKVFISYRRDDSKYQARMIHTAFCKAIQSDHVFMDVDSIPPGANFRKILKGWIDECEVLLALIGPGWIDASDPKTKRRRLDNPSDFVRIEIGEALARDIPVVPVLIDGTPIPDVGLLPDVLKGLVDRQAEFLEFRTFDADVERLIRKLRLNQGVGRTIASSDDRYRAEGRIKVDAAIVDGAPEGWFLPGNGKAEWFQDHYGGPEMVVVPAGRFTMGSPETEPDRRDSEGPQHPVTIARPFGAGRHAVTRGQFAAFVNNTGYRAQYETEAKKSWRNPGFPQDDSHSVVYVSWEDAKSFVAWLSTQSGRDYRLLTEAEWEYAARAGTTTPFRWGSTTTLAQEQAVAAGNFAANPWGLYQVGGDVLEWCEDVWHDNYNGAPSDGSAWLQGGDTSRRVVRGGSWGGDPRCLRLAGRGARNTDVRGYLLGFRVGRTLSP
ncbi:MAG TPA: SUMF1/EgtB/PvdO family nonheme iron enzyme [Casimicrobiaceae bacterium]|nr:SUMF1/EgtB/PvdO family nonheme iron enzyme [Casimicrobiaceae bacterium]